MRVIKRRKGSKEYFYLQNSVRKGNKVVTKEVYIGKTLPKDISEYEKRVVSGNTDVTTKRLEAIKVAFEKEWTRRPHDAKEKELESIAVAFTYNTNAIEGSKITLPETMNLLRNGIAPNKPVRDVKETENHRKVFLEMLKEKVPVSDALILKWHRGLFVDTKPNIAGRFRNYGVSIGAYLAPGWWDVPKLMRSLVKLSNDRGMNPVELAARVHYRFEKIHPFGDGNGRIGRLLMNYVLWRRGYPMLIIEYSKRGAYYRALSTEEKFVRYLIRLYLSVHRARYARQ